MDKKTVLLASACTLLMMISFDMGYIYTGIRTVHYYLEPMR